jgi:hypothetical protein
MKYSPPKPFPESFSKHCDHDYKILDIVYVKKSTNTSDIYIRNTTFFCSKCLQESESIKREEVYKTEYKDKPVWFKS